MWAILPFLFLFPACSSHLFEPHYETVVVDKLDRSIVKEYKSSRSTANQLLSNALRKARKQLSTKPSDEEAIAFMESDEIERYEEARDARDEALSKIQNFNANPTKTTNRRLTSDSTIVHIYNGVEGDATFTTGILDDCSDATDTLEVVANGEWYSDESADLSDYLCVFWAGTNDDATASTDSYMMYTTTSYMLIYGVVKEDTWGDVDLDITEENWYDFDPDLMELRIVHYDVSLEDEDFYLCFPDSTLVTQLSAYSWETELEIGEEAGDDYEDIDFTSTDGASLDIYISDNAQCSEAFQSALSVELSTSLTVNFYSMAICIVGEDEFVCKQVAQMTEDDACAIYDDDTDTNNGCTNDDGSFYCCTSLWFDLPDCADGDNTCTNDESNKKTAEAFGTILIVIIVLVVLSIIGCILCCCACIKGCPLYEKCCCSPKENQSSSQAVEMTQDPK